MKKNVIIWRLSEKPSTESLRELVKDGILTKDEARQILFNEVEMSDNNESGRTKGSLEEEIKFLRELVDKLSKNRTEIVETIRYVEKPYIKYDWIRPYTVWCNSLQHTDNVDINTITSSAGSNNLLNLANAMFKDIQTF